MSSPHDPESRVMKLVIDTGICTGHGRCVAHAPELFDDDDNGYGHVIGDGNVSADLADKARKAMQACPERAISLVD
jgi:ferredoxin